MAPLPSHLQALLPDASSLRLEHVEHVSNPILIVVSSAPESARCPICDTLSRRIHSRYERSIRDLPWHGRFVRIKLRCRRFHCQSPTCSRKIFAERLPDVVKHYGRRTERFRETINIIGYALGGEAGARLAERIGLECSADAILRELKNITTEASRPGVRVLGVDDWAWRKGQSYGTILVDLERRRPIDLLPDRSARSFQRWLADHPGVEVITRDRAGLYAEGGKRGAPNALQVADRFHLVCNLSTAAERFLQQKRFPSFRPSVELPLGEGQSEVCRMASPKTEPPWKAQRRQRRVDRYEEVRRLHQEGHSQKAISQLLGMGRKTIRRFIRAGEFPERKAARRPSRLDRFRNYLEQRWSEGCHNATQLWREIQEQGYKGCRGMVANLVTSFRAPGTKYFRGSGSINRSRRNLASPSPAQVASLLIRHPDKLATRDREWLVRLLGGQPDIGAMYSLVQDFSTLLRTRNAAGLPDWIGRAVHAKIPALTSFVAGLGRDHAAVEAAFYSAWSNGQVEGQVHRLKLIKRQMYGRAGFVLLRRRVLPFRIDQQQAGP